MAPATTKTDGPKKVSTGGVKKGKGKNTKARAAMIKMQAFFKANRDDYKDLDFKEQQKKLGEDWKKSPENPKNQAAS